MKYVFLSASIGLTVFIFSMSQATGEESASMSLSLAQWLSDHLIPPRWIPLESLHVLVRKGAHVAEYAVLGGSYALTFRSFRWPWWAMILLGIIVALGDEASQSLSEGRGPSVMDAVMFDIPGFILGVLPGWKIFSKINVS